MKKQILLITFLLFSHVLCNNESKVALVLSGGGAKGMAQIPIIEIIDSLNIPIDYVVGTSIGSINGAMYAMGYSPIEIKNLGYNTNWDLIFSNKKNRKKLFYFHKNDYGKYQIEFTLDGIKPVAPIALSNGHSSYMNLNNKTKNHEHLNSFNELLIPFRCNAVDLLGGEEIIFQGGSLSKALRASSSIPSVFNPLMSNNNLLVDGGVLNNFPIDIAKNLGADIIIGINVSPIDKNVSDINDIFDVLTQSILLNGYDKRKSNIEFADLILEPNVNSFGTIDFSNSSLDILYKNGKKAAYENFDELLALKNQIKDNISNKIKISAIPKQEFIINKISIENNDGIVFDEIFPNIILPLTITKNDFSEKILNLRDLNIFSHISYHFLNKEDGYELILNIKKIPDIILNKVIVIGNEELKTSFIKELLNLESGIKLDINQLIKNIDRAYNLELFNSIRYELIQNKDKYDIYIYIDELPFHTMKLAGLWNNYHKLIANIKFSLFNKPIKRFKFTNDIKFGTTIKENVINMHYIGNYNHQTQIIPTLKFKNTKNEMMYINSNGLFENIIISNKNYSVNGIFPLKELGFIDIGLNKQKIKYESENHSKIEKYSYFDLNFNIDQLDDLLYPSEGYRYNLYIEQPWDVFSYYIYKLSFDHFIPIDYKNKIKLYGDFMFSDLSNLPYDDLLLKNVNYINYDRTLSHSEYDLFANDFVSYGIEYNYFYKNSTTFRVIYNNMDSITSKYNNEINSNVNSYAFGFRVKSILGPFNFLWTHAENSLYGLNEKDSYFFSLGINL